MRTPLDRAQEAFKKYKALCFFDIRDDFRVTEENVSFVLARLRSEGNMKTFRIATEIEKELENKCR
jgi:hypothetical protein